MKAIRAAWSSFGKRWHSAKPVRVKIIVFKCLVYETAIYLRVDCSSPAKAHTDCLNSCVLHYARKMLGKHAIWTIPISQHDDPRLCTFRRDLGRPELPGSLPVPPNPEPQPFWDPAREDPRLDLGGTFRRDFGQPELPGSLPANASRSGATTVFGPRP